MHLERLAGDPVRHCRLDFGTSLNPEQGPWGRQAAAFLPEGIHPVSWAVLLFGKPDALSRRQADGENAAFEPSRRGGIVVGLDFLDSGCGDQSQASYAQHSM